MPALQIVFTEQGAACRELLLLCHSCRARVTTPSLPQSHPGLATEAQRRLALNRTWQTDMTSEPHSSVCVAPEFSGRAVAAALLRDFRVREGLGCPLAVDLFIPKRHNQTALNPPEWHVANAIPLKWGEALRLSERRHNHAAIQSILERAGGRAWTLCDFVLRALEPWTAWGEHCLRINCFEIVPQTSSIQPASHAPGSSG
jgi:hypothetical protein